MNIIHILPSINITVDQLDNCLLKALGREVPDISYEVSLPSTDELMAQVKKPNLSTYSDKDSEERFYDFVESFLESLEESTIELAQDLNLSSDYELGYSLEQCVQLYTQSSSINKKARLIPKIIWPSDKECISALERHIGPLPFKCSGLAYEPVELKLEDGEYSFEVQGERGEIQVSECSEDKDEVFLAAFHYFVRQDYYEEDENFIFMEGTKY